VFAKENAKNLKILFEIVELGKALASDLPALRRN
jgi:hypothetical protein